jgi:uncharacterized SAM-dependent methyltransferase
LIGVDLMKDPDVLHAAYNDSQGVTAAFNLNLLARLNRELDANFNIDSFVHEAVYDDDESRIEMRLVSLRQQRVRVAGVNINFDRGEYIITEYSHKYSLAEFQAMAARAGFEPRQVWVDEAKLFSVHYMTVQ